MKKDNGFTICLCLLFCVFFCSCSIRPKTPQPIEYYTVNYKYTSLEALPTLPVALSLESLCTTAPYNTTRIIYSTGEYVQNKYYYHRWMTTPGEMVTPLIARDMIASNRFQAVMVSCNFLTKHQLIGTIDEFYEQDTESGWNAVISITFTLVNVDAEDENHRISFQKQYTRTQAMEEKNPKSLAQAMSKSIAEISGLMITDIYNTLQGM